MSESPEAADLIATHSERYIAQAVSTTLRENYQTLLSYYKKLTIPEPGQEQVIVPFETGFELANLGIDLAIAEKFKAQKERFLMTEENKNCPLGSLVVAERHAALDKQYLAARGNLWWHQMKRMDAKDPDHPFTGSLLDLYRLSIAQYRNQRSWGREVFNYYNVKFNARVVENLCTWCYVTNRPKHYNVEVVPIVPFLYSEAIADWLFGSRRASLDQVGNALVLWEPLRY